MNGTPEFIVDLWLLPVIINITIPLVMLLVWGLSKQVVRFVEKFHFKSDKSNDRKIINASLSVK